MSKYILIAEVLAILIDGVALDPNERVRALDIIEKIKPEEKAKADKKEGE